MTSLPGLNTVRFLLALNVLYVHFALYERIDTFPLFSGHDAVTMFFVLSGYLVGYRLLHEQRTHGTIDVRAFYRRRAWRILPLYSVLVIVGGVLLPAFGASALSLAALVSVLLLMPQMAYALGWPMGMIVPLWSVGVEAMFYVFFPLAMRRCPLPHLCIAVIVFLTALSGAAFLIHSPLLPLLRLMRFECMAVGSLAAWGVVSRSRWLALAYHRGVERGALVGLLCVAIGKPILPAHDLTVSLLAIVFLVNVSTNPDSVCRLEWAWSQAAGQLSYGLYLWHVPVLWALSRLTLGAPFLAASVTVSLLLSWASYVLIERPTKHR